MSDAINDRCSGCPIRAQRSAQSDILPAKRKEMSVYQKRAIWEFEKRFIARIKAAGDKKDAIANLKKRTQNFMKNPPFENAGYNFMAERELWNFFDHILNDEINKPETPRFIKDIFEKAQLKEHLKVYIMNLNFLFFTGVVKTKELKRDIKAYVKIWAQDIIGNTVNDKMPGYLPGRKAKTGGKVMEFKAEVTGQTPRRGLINQTPTEGKDKTSAPRARDERIGSSRQHPARSGETRGSEEMIGGYRKEPSRGRDYRIIDAKRVRVKLFGL